MENIQFKKGVLELCVLVLVKNKDHYGYELVNSISQFIEISEGTIYPMLRRLTNEGYFTTYLMESQSGPPRKYYRITEEGRAYCEQQIKQWQQFVVGVSAIIKQGGNDDET